MEKGPASVRNVMYNSRASLLPPKIPAIGQSYTEYVPSSAYGSRNNEKIREWNPHHQRTSSESLLIEEQPSWLDELLDEPETPVRKVGHRRSSSDSFAYTDAASVVNMGGYLTKNDNQFRNITPFPSWGSKDFDHFSKVHHASFGVDPNPVGKHKNWAWDAPVNSVSRARGFSSPSNIVQSSGSAQPLQRADGNPSLASEMKEAAESASHESKGSAEKKDSSHGKPSSSETDTKRAKQQFAQRSRVRKLQYIAELERNVQALQGETSEASAQLEFIHQQNLILGMENKALKQRLESLAQEQLIKYLEQEVLEREVARLRALYQQQQQPQPPPQRSGHRRNTSRDLDQQLADLSLKSKDNNPARDPVF